MSAQTEPAGSTAEVGSRQVSFAAATSVMTWRSAKCSANSCVEVAMLADGGIAIRDGKAGDTGDVLIFSGDEWSAFVTGIKAGEFD